MEKKSDEDNNKDIINKNNLNKNKITEKHLNNLDEFIQKCLDNFKFVEPKQELYDATGSDKNIIISHKSTIPDLVIWNKTFNKNNCFIGANANKETKFPRFLFYIKIKKNKKTKKNNTENINKINFNKNNSEQEISQNNNNEIINKEKNKNKFSINQNLIMENNMNNLNMLINLTTYLIQLYLYKDGWIILTNDNFSGPGTSINLYQFLQEKLKENCDLDNFIIIDINKQIKFTGNNFYNLLSNSLQKILQKKQMELIKFEEIVSKQFKNNNNKDINNNKINSNFSNNNNNSNNHININLYNNQIFPGINYIGNINNNIANANFIQNNIINYDYNINKFINNNKKTTNEQSNDNDLVKK